MRCRSIRKRLLEPTRRKLTLILFAASVNMGSQEPFAAIRTNVGFGR